MQSPKLPSQGEKYYHYKHNPNSDDLNYCYEVIGIAKHTETRESVVVYKPLYECEIELFVRPLTMFLEIIEIPEINYIGPRFKLNESSIKISESQKITLDTYNNNFDEYYKFTRSIMDNPEAKTWLNKVASLFDKQLPILEIGAGTGVCSDYLEFLEFEVDRTDCVDSFLKYNQRIGKSISVLNILEVHSATKYNQILANAVLHHFNEVELLIALKNINESLNDNGLFAFSTKFGAGEEISNFKMNSPRFFRYWCIETIKPILIKCGFSILDFQETKNWLRIVVQKI